jgi:methionyl-tRNA formyltransferase
MRLIFLGTPAFAVPTLERIVAAGHSVRAVVTQPDRPRGRGQNAAAPPVKQAALRLGLPVYQPERVRRVESVEYLRGYRWTPWWWWATGRSFRRAIIDMAPLGIINVHGSLLPHYRGAGPIQWAILNGETRTGVTTMRIDAGLDTGDMLLKAETEIGPGETAVELGQRLAMMGADLLVETLAGLAAGRIVPEKQDNEQATYAPLLKKEDGRIDWSARRRRFTIRCAVCSRGRARRPASAAKRCTSGNRGCGADPAAIRSPGTLVSLKPPVVSCGTGALELVEVQLEGRKRIPASDFANGQRLTENESIRRPTRLKLPLGYLYSATYAGIRQAEKDDLA